MEGDGRSGSEMMTQVISSSQLYIHSVPGNSEDTQGQQMQKNIRGN